jgi:endonuclease YncB( thermonuclease family)
MRAAVLTLVLATMALAGFPGPLHAEPIARSRIEVIDGDTIRVDGQPVRLLGLNAPETGERASCDVERRAGEAAKRLLQALVAEGGLDVRFGPCACRPGTEGTPLCNYGRRCAAMWAQGSDVARSLIRARLAVPFECTARRCAPMQRPWCRGSNGRSAPP